MPPSKIKRTIKPVRGFLTTFDDAGDLRLVVGTHEAKRTFVVCSRSVARASRPFKAMLFGGFAESQSSKMNPNWTVELPEDNPQALATVLHIVHGHFKAIPDIVDRDDLYQITILTDKYKMTEILDPWASKWVTSLYESFAGQMGDEVLLWISWELGHEELFRKTLEWLEDECTYDEDLKVCSSHGVPLDNIYLDSLDIPDLIATERVEGIALMITYVEEVIDLLSGASGEDRPGRLGGQMVCSEECRTFYLGSIIRSLKKVDYWPLPSPETHGPSMSSCRVRLMMAIQSMQVLHEISKVSHVSCCPTYDLVTQISEVAPCIHLNQAQREHLAAQAVRSGLSEQTY